MGDSTLKIYPRCKADMNAVYISAEGTVYPCCWLGNYPHSKDYREFHGESHEKLNINKRKLKDILVDPIYHRVEKSWTLEPLPSCKEFCGQPLSRSNERTDGTNEVLNIKLNNN